MSESPEKIDLKLMPDWLKETPAKNPYENYAGDDFERPRRDWSERGAPQRQRKPERKPPRESRERRPASAPRSDFRPDSAPPRAPQPQETPAPVNIEFVTQPELIGALARQIKSTSQAYPLFGLARMFLEKPERHRVRITAQGPGVSLFQLGEDGVVALDRETLERVAFDALRSTFYVEEKTEREPPKGNYSNVARCRLSGTLLGPTNYHDYQPAVRKLYDERFSRRMSFPDYQREIEIVNDPAAIDAWKEQTRAITTYKTAEETDQVTFATIQEVEQHFRKNHLEQNIRTGSSFELRGDVSRQIPDRRLMNAVRNAWEQERSFPGQLMHQIRRHFIDAKLYIFKHHKRMLFASSLRPQPFTGNTQTFSENIAQLLDTIRNTRRCTRSSLGQSLLVGDPADLETRKSAMASDLRWLIAAGRVIEFHDGTLELPIVQEPYPRRDGAPERREAAEPKAEQPEVPVNPPVPEQ